MLTVATPEDVLGTKQLAAIALSALDHRERAVVFAHIMDGATYDEAAREGVPNKFTGKPCTRERARQIEYKAIRKMRFAVMLHECEIDRGATVPWVSASEIARSVPNTRRKKRKKENNRSAPQRP